jgi:hypothetical protein
MITGGSSLDFKNKRHKKDHYRRVNHVAVTRPVVQTKWSHVPLTFDARDVDPRCAPHADALVIKCNMAGRDLHKVLVDNGSQVDIIFLHAFDRIGINHSLLLPADNPLYGFRGKGTFSLGKIELSLSLDTPPNERSEQVAPFGMGHLTPGPEDTNFADWWGIVTIQVHRNKRKGVNSAIILGAWCLWLHRNRVIFDGDSPTIGKVHRRFIDELSLWVLAGAKHLGSLGLAAALGAAGST